MKFITLFLTLLIGTLACWGRVIKVCKPKNEFTRLKYGEKVKVNGKKMSYSIVGEDNDSTIVLLPGLGLNSPIISFKPFAEALSEKFKVVTLEPFGYGFSDVADSERNSENIISEIHTALHNIGVDKFYLVGHSLGGLYSLGYANKYPEDLLGVVGIDNTPTEIEDVKIDYNELAPFFEYCSEQFKAGYWKTATQEEFIANSFPIDFTYNYPEEDLKNLKIIFGYTYCNENYVDEAYHFNSTIDELKNLQFPENIPVLQFISSVNSEHSDLWEPSHKDLVSNTIYNNEVIKLEGSHFLYIDQKVAIVEKIEEWINEN